MLTEAQVDIGTDGEVYLKEDEAKRLKELVVQYMKDEYSDHIDYDCGVYDTTSAAEDAASHFDLYYNVDQIPQEVFEWAHEVCAYLVRIGDAAE